MTNWRQKLSINLNFFLIQVLKKDATIFLLMYLSEEKKENSTFEGQPMMPDSQGFQ